MRNYYINTNSTNTPNNNNEIHKDTCIFFPSADNRKLLGFFSTDTEALQSAFRQGYHKADGCYFCCPGIHKN